MIRRMKSHWRKWLVAAAVIVCPACAHRDRTRPLTPAVFTASPAPRSDKDVNIDPLSRADQPGQLFNNAHAESMPQDGARRGNGVARPSKTVQENVTGPGAGEDLGAETPPATTTAASPGLSTGQYLTIGGVVAEVNATPIYTKQVMRLAEPILAPRARQLSPEQFRFEAIKTIKEQRDALIGHQLQYFAAEKNLDEKEKKLADLLTMQWRQQQIIAAGGSEEVARQRAALRGQDFDEMVRQEYRLIMRQILVQKKLMPQVVVSADEIRAYYNHNRDREFADPGSARFRLIKIDVGKSGGEEKAQQRIESIRNRVAKAGESFEIIARTENDDAHLRSTGGDVGGAIQKGAFALEPVEQAVWSTPDGDVTPVIRIGSAFYIARVEEKKSGHVRPFEDEDVQMEINEKLSSTQLRELQQRMLERLFREAVITQNEEMLNTAVEIAMQNYPRWAGK